MARRALGLVGLLALSCGPAAGFRIGGWARRSRVASEGLAGLAPRDPDAIRRAVAPPAKGQRGKSGKQAAPKTGPKPAAEGPAGLMEAPKFSERSSSAAAVALLGYALGAGLDESLGAAGSVSGAAAGWILSGKDDLLGDVSRSLGGLLALAFTKVTDADQRYGYIRSFGEASAMTVAKLGSVVVAEPSVADAEGWRQYLNATEQKVEGAQDQYVNFVVANSDRMERYAEDLATAARDADRLVEVLQDRRFSFAFGPEKARNLTAVAGNLAGMMTEARIGVTELEMRTAELEKELAARCVAAERMIGDMRERDENGKRRLADLKAAQETVVQLQASVNREEALRLTAEGTSSDVARECEAAKAEVAELAAQIEDIGGQMEAWEAEKAALTLTVADKDKEINRICLDLTKARNDLVQKEDGFTVTLAERAAEIEVLRGQVEGVSKRLTGREEALADVRSELKAAKEELRALGLVEASLQKTLKEKEAGRASISEEVTKREGTIRERDTQIKSLEESLASVTAETEALEAQITEFGAAEAASRKELAALGKERDELTVRCTDLEDRVGEGAEVSEKLAKVEAELKEATASATAAKPKAAAKAKAKAAEDRAELQEIRAENKKLAKELKKRSSTVESLEKRLAERETASSAAGAELAELRKEVELLSAQRDDDLELGAGLGSLGGVDFPFGLVDDVGEMDDEESRIGYGLGMGGESDASGMAMIAEEAGFDPEEASMLSIQNSADEADDVGAMGEADVFDGAADELDYDWADDHNDDDREIEKAVNDLNALMARDADSQRLVGTVEEAEPARVPVAAGSSEPLEETLMGYTVKDLKSIARKNGLTVGGRKAELVDRIAGHAGGNPRADLDP